MILSGQSISDLPVQTAQDASWVVESWVGCVVDWTNSWAVVRGQSWAVVWRDSWVVVWREGWEPWVQVVWVEHFAAVQQCVVAVRVVWAPIVFKINSFCNFISNQSKFRRRNLKENYKRGLTPAGKIFNGTFSISFSTTSSAEV